MASLAKSARLLMTAALFTMVQGLPALVLAEKGPAIQVPDPAYTFPKSVEGSEITHDFAILNKGDADLVILNVRTG